MQSEKTWRAGVAGLRRGLSYVRQLSTTPEVELVAVADLDDETVERVRRDHNVPRGYGTLHEMLGAQLDLVVIATPLHLHAQHAVEALDRGVHVLSEVTACGSLEEADALVAAVERSGRTYMMAENCCYEERFVLRQERPGHDRTGHAPLTQSRELRYIHEEIVSLAQTSIRAPPRSPGLLPVRLPARTHKARPGIF